MNKESGSAYSLTMWAAVGIIVALLLGFGALQLGYESTADPVGSFAATAGEEALSPLSIPQRQIDSSVAAEVIDPPVFGASEVEIATAPNVSGTVTGKSPTFGGTVQAYAQDGSLVQQASVQGSDGSYQLSLPEATYMLKASRRTVGTGYLPYTTTITIPPSQVVDVDFRDIDSRRITGTVSGFSPEQLGAMTLRVRDAGLSGPTQPLQVDVAITPTASGTYTAHVPIGSWRINSATRISPGSRTVDTSAGNVGGVNFEAAFNVTGTVILKSLPGSGSVDVYEQQGQGEAAAQAGDQPPVASGQVQSDGSYTVTVSSGTYTFRTHVTGYAPITQTVEVTGDMGGVGLDLATADPRQITGTVSGLSGSEWDGVSINLSSEGGGGMSFSVQPVTTTGTYSANVPGYSAWRLSISEVLGKVRPQLDDSVSVTGSDVGGVDFAYEDGSTITGTVTITGQVPEGSAVQAFLPGGMESSWGASLDASGRYTLTVPDGSMQLRTSVAGWWPLAADITAPLSPTHAVDFDLATADAHVISGTITGLDQSELESLWVNVSDAGQMGGPGSVWANALIDSETGFFSLHVPNGTWRVQPGDVDGKVTPDTQNVPIINSDGFVAFAYTSGVTVNGTVTLRPGDSPHWSNVQVYVPGSWQPLSWANIDEDDGSYSVTLSQGTYEFRPQVRGYYPISTIFTATAGTTNTLDFDLSASNPYSITGSVTGVGDLDVGDWQFMRVEARSNDQMGPGLWAEANPVAPSGVFTLNMPAGTWRVDPPQIVGRVAPSSQQAQLSASDPHVQLLPFAFGSGYTISGTVYVNETPATAWSGHVDAQDANTKMYVAGTPVGSGGSYALTLGPGSYTIRAQVQGYFPATKTFTDLSENHLGEDFEVAGSGSYTITGLIVGLPDSRLPMANVWVQNPMEMGPGAGALWAQPDQSSRRYSVRVPEGTWRVMGNRVPGFGQPNPVTVVVDEDNPTATADMEYASGFLLSGTVTDPDGAPLPNVGMHLFNADHSMDQGGGTGNSGSYEFGGLITGTYTLEVFMPWGQSGLLPPPPITVEITGSNVTQDIQFLTAPKRIQGTVYKAASGEMVIRPKGQERFVEIAVDGDPVEGAEIFANQDKGGGGVGTRTDADGNYQLGVGPGSWWVNVHPSFRDSAPDWTYTKPPTVVTFANDDTEETMNVDFGVQVTGSKVRGRILQPNGSPVENGFVNLDQPGQWGGGAPVLPNGTFTVPVQAGTYMMNVWLPDQRLGLPSTVTDTLGVVASLRTGFNVADGATRDLGDITLTRKNSGIAGRITRSDTGAGVEGVWVHAQSLMGPGWGDAQTDSNGAYQLWVNPGRYRVDASPSRDSDFGPTDGGETQVTADGVSTVNIQLTVADATIAGRVVLAGGEGTPVTDIYGGAFAFEPGANKTGAFAPLMGGNFEIKVAAGSYRVGVGLPPGANYSMYGEPVSVTVESGETANVQVLVLSNNSVIEGDLREYPSGDPVTGLMGAMVFAGNGKGPGSMAQVDPEAGTYRLNVASGVWDQHLELPRDSGYMLRQGQSTQVSVLAGETVSVSLQVIRASRVIRGNVTDPDGTALTGAFVSVENPTGMGKDRFIAGGPTDWNGDYVISVAPGQYEVRANGRFDLGFMSPPPQQVDVSEGDAEGVDFQFLGTNVTLSGQITRGGTGTFGMVRIHSSDGSGTMAFADEDGYYTADLTEGTWFMEAVSHDTQTFYKSEEISRTLTAGDATQDFAVEEFIAIPPSGVFTFDSAEMQVLRLSDGTEIQIPAGALAAEGDVTVSAVPKAEMPVQGGTKPVNLGYTLTASDSDGVAITSFRSNVTIVLHYTDEQLEALGIREEDLIASYWDETTSSWKTVANMSLDPDENTLSISVDHFTDYAVTTNGTGEADEAVLEADFTGYPVTGTAPLTVVFTDTTSGGTPTSWLWNFGDTYTSADQNPTHVYSTTGVYTVTLLAATADASDTVTKTSYITVAWPYQTTLPNVGKTQVTPPEGALEAVRSLWDDLVSGIGGLFGR